MGLVTIVVLAMLSKLENQDYAKYRENPQMIALEKLTTYIRANNPELTQQLEVPFAYSSLLGFLSRICLHYNLEPPAPEETIAEVTARMLEEIKTQSKQ